MIRILPMLLFLIIAIASAKSVGVLDRESCFYNGKKLNKGIAEETASETPKVPENFTGTAVCYDIRDNRRTEEIHIKNGKKDGWERRYDRSTGKLAEEIHHVDGKRHGVMRRYDHRNGGLQQEMHYQNGQLHGVQKSYYSDSGQLRRIQWSSQPRPKGEITDISFNKDGSLSMLRCGAQVISIQDSRWCGRDGKSSKVVLYAADGENGSWPREVRHYKNNLD